MSDFLEKVRILRRRIEKAARTIPDSEAPDFIELFPSWKTGIVFGYENGEWTVDGESVGNEAPRYREGDTLYKVLQAHTTQDGWQPHDAPSLWAKVLIPDPEQIYPWEQPDSTNPYGFGDKVTHGGHVWVSTAENNVWEPGVYGWEQED